MYIPCVKKAPMNFKIFIYIPQKMIIYENIEYQLVVIYFIAQPKTNCKLQKICNSKTNLSVQ